MKNIIDTIDSNFFLKKIYPEGLNVFALGNLILGENRIEMSFHTSQEPQFQVDKWGAWGVQYNVVVIHVNGQFLNKVVINNWQNNNITKCRCELQVIGNVKKFRFEGDDWSFDMELEAMIFQRCSTYINDNLIL